MMFQRVAIIGLGLIGGSIGLALHKAKIAQEVVGYDLGSGVTERARRIGAIDASCDALADVVRGAELVVLATPVGSMHSILQGIASAVTPGTIVTDVASTKEQVIQWAEELLPASVSFVGGHPMAGKELSGVEAADAELFQGHIYCITPTEHTRPLATSKVAALVESMGARVRFLSPAEHDQQVAGVSHLPFLASIALVNTVVESPSWGDAALLAANGFRDMSRLAAGSPAMYRDICLTNSEAIVGWLDAYIATLQSLRERVAERSHDLNKSFVEAQEARLRWQSAHEHMK